MMKKANPTLEGQLLEYLESAPDEKSEVMWNVLQHLRARQRGETIENPTIEGRIAEYFETASLEKAEVLFNIIELKLGKRMERGAEEIAVEAEAPNPARSKRTHTEGKGKAKAKAAAPSLIPAQAASASAPAERAGTGNRAPETRVETRVIEASMREPIIVPDDDLGALDASAPEMDDLPPEISDDLLDADLSQTELDGPVTAEVDVA